jgi:hypothetical protein
MMRPGDVLSILDHDMVEDRNLLRQHFTGADIGSPKALVLANRYRKPNMEVHAYVRQLTEDTAQGVVAAITEPFEDMVSRLRPAATVFIGCVDNAAARRGIRQALLSRTGQTSQNFAWIDVGNEMRAGQVLLTLKSWNLRIPGIVNEAATLVLDGMSAMPQLLRDAPEETASCGDRIDLQTVQVNHMAAGAAINVVSWLMLGIPFTSCGAFFSTLNTMEPIRIDRIDRNVLIPDSQYAISA